MTFERSTDATRIEEDHIGHERLLFSDLAQFISHLRTEASREKDELEKMRIGEVASTFVV